MSRSPFAVVPCLGLILASYAAAQDQALREAARLDAEQKCEEAEHYYQEALRQAPRAPAVLNNAGNHYLVCGQPDKARTYFEQLIRINPIHANANLQLARIAAEQKQGVKALEYLARLKDGDPVVRLLRAEASYLAGNRAAALTMLNGVEKEANGDPRVLYLLGLTCARIRLYDRAEVAFNAVLVRHPDDFDVLFNLGRAAARAQHFDRAQRALEVALRLQPDSADTLLELGRVYAARQDYSRAVYRLAQASRKTPKRPDILLALARAAEDAGYYGDSALACDEYLQLRPADDTARRDCARIYGYTGARLEEGVRELTWYVQKHPDDPVGHYDLAQFSWRTNPQKALDQLSAALHLDPNFTPAYYARAWLLHRLGRTAESLPDLQAAARMSPKEFHVLDQLGLAYLSLDQPSEAEKVLRKALVIAPEDPEVLMHLGRALIALDREEEAQVFLDKFQKVRPRRARDPRKEAGMIESARLPVAERTAREIERLRRDASSHAGDPDLQLHLALLLLADGRVDEAGGEFRKLLAMHADNRIWAEAGTSLIRSEQYELARQFLERAATENPTSRLDLAVALFFTEGPTQALQVIEKVPDGVQAGDYWLMKARILDAVGQGEESQKALEEGLHHSTSRPEVAQQGARLLLLHNRRAEALDILNRAIESAPDNADLLLTRAIVLGLMDQNSAAQHEVKQIESRWPEWDRPYLVAGLLSENNGHLNEARQELETATALDSNNLVARCGLARLSGSASPDPQCPCQARLYQLLFPSCSPK
jgi:tetratricopeptide (TPR) repeat protein